MSRCLSVFFIAFGLGFADEVREDLEGMSCNLLQFERPYITTEQLTEEEEGEAAAQASDGGHWLRPRLRPSESFEGCRAALRARSEAADAGHHGTPARLLETAGASSPCGGAEVQLHKEGLSSVVSTCCPADSLSCAGCAKMSGAVCSVCRGGFQLEDGKCSMCANSAGWVNDAGDSCERANCSDVKHHGLSSNQACCACGGGHKAAIPFAFDEVNLLLDASEVQDVYFPVPRTATRYSVNAACELSRYGLSIDGVTGKLRMATGCDRVGCGATEPFSVTCEVTAHQSPELNATAPITVRVSRFAYGKNTLVVRPGKNTFTPLLGVSGASMSCVPSSTQQWLSVADDGTLSALAHIDGSKGGLIMEPHLGVLGGRCSVTATVEGKKLSTSIIALAPQIWSTFGYGTSVIHAAVGEEALPIKVSGVDKGLVAPKTFSAYCESSETTAKYVFDVSSGVATLDGHTVFTLDLITGTLHLVPSKLLEKTLNDFVDDGVLRKQISLTCTVYGHYLEQPTIPERIVPSSQLEIQLRDSICWVERVADFVGRENIAASDLKACFKACREAPDCTDFEFSGNGKCRIMKGLCLKGISCRKQNVNVYTKVPNCGERSTCIEITDEQHAWISGAYCPVGENAGAMVYLKAGETVPDTLYLTKYSDIRDGQAPGCEPGRYAIKQAAPGKDFDDPESAYIELKGDTVKCLEFDVDLVDGVFSDGSLISDDVSVEVVGLSCGAPNVTAATDGTEESAVSPLVLDDPSTPEPSDHWMHPCDCFPETWGISPPVTAEAFEAVPAGSENQFSPSVVEIVNGAYTCEDEHVIDGQIILQDQADAGDTKTCEVFCKEKGCAFFWEGEVQSAKQCRLYSACKSLVHEIGIHGSLKAIPASSKKYCHIADPHLCWAVTGRRSLLNAGQQRDELDCAWSDLIGQCDHKLLLGGVGIEQCGVCTLREASTQSFTHKAKLPSMFMHGQKLHTSCWEERFRAMPLATGSKLTSSLTCVSGHWLDNQGHLGLSNFACAACVQIVSPPYSQLAERNKQELYFASIAEVKIEVKMKTQRVVLRSGALDGQLDSTPGNNPSASQKPLLECQGRCRNDYECLGSLQCFERSGFDPVPGCQGKGKKNWNYCIAPTNEVFEIESLDRVFKRALLECEGHCQNDDHCEGELKCFKRGGKRPPVPGCSGIGGTGWNYCYDPAKYKVIDHSPGLEGVIKLGVCQGDCDRNSDCAGSLKCKDRPKTQIKNGKLVTPKNKVPGCNGTGSKSRDYCWDPTGASPVRVIDNSPGLNGVIKLQACQASCGSDDDCAAGLTCFQRTNNAKVPGCNGSAQNGWGYCVMPTTIALSNYKKPFPQLLKECQGNCDYDSDCIGNLECFKNTGNKNKNIPVPGCQGNKHKVWGYCYDPAKANSWQGTSSDLSITGFIVKTIPSFPDEQKVIESIGQPGICLEVVPSGASNGMKGLKASACADPPTHAQLISAWDLPKLIQQKFEDLTLGLVPDVAVNETSMQGTEAKLRDFLIEQDCGEHAMNAFGWHDRDNDGKLGMFARCTPSSVLGSPTKFVAKLGGSMDVEFSTCSTPSSAKTGDRIYYRINNLVEKRLGAQGRDLGAKDKFTLTYNEPFERMEVRGSTGDGWKICSVKVGGDELPTESLDISFPEMPCWIDQVPGTGDDCHVHSMSIVGNRMAQELAHARIECPLGQAITYLKKEASRFVYKCSFLAGMGACTPGQSVQIDTSSGKLDSLKDFNVVCPEGEVIQSMVAEESSGGKWLRYRYMCCANSAVPINLALTGGRREDNLQKMEGIYCPTNRDVSGRLNFNRVFAFVSSEEDVPLNLSFDRDRMAWCVNATCLKSGAAHPLDAGFEGTTYEALPLTNFDGKFEGKGVPKAPGRGKMKRKKPQLIEFGATQPEYAAECKDEVTPGSSSFDLDKMNSEGMTLPEGNPCRNIAGAWVRPEPILTPTGPVQLAPEGEGRSYWTNGGYDDSDGDMHAGTTYDSVLACADREISRDLVAATSENAHDTAENVMDLAFSIYTLPCALAPDAEVAPMGMGIQWKTGDTCDAIMERVQSAANFVNNQIRISGDWNMAQKDNADCNSAQHGLSRIFCDLHCIRDAVKAGDQAILKSLEKTVKVVGENTNLLLDYYSGKLQDSVDGLAETVGSGGSYLQAKQMSESLRSSFAEISVMLQGNFATGPKASVTRALDEFSARFGQTGASSTWNARNASILMTSLTEETRTLQAVVQLSTSSGRMSASAQAAHAATAMMQRLQRVLRTRVGTLGVYRKSAMKAKERQMQMSTSARAVSAGDVLDELRTSSARALLLDLDRTWWELRAKLDGYLEAADEQAAAFEAAFVQLDAYTSQCRIGFSELKASYNKAMHAEAHAHGRLRETYASVSQSLGLLAAKIQDGEAFWQLARLDVSALDKSVLGENKTAICGSGDGESAVDASARAAIENATDEGFMGQTWMQVHGLFRQVPMLQDRFLAGGLRAPGHEDILQAWSRIADSYKDVVGRRGQLARDWTARVRTEMSC